MLGRHVSAAQGVVLSGHIWNTGRPMLGKLSLINGKGGSCAKEILSGLVYLECLGYKKKLGLFSTNAYEADG